ncbi:hypothetical protein H696_02761 [Fonticula alba]|uniref:Uncharacterized protein n=1 Tax=Fonticula alba TaxID=691883 RepID=A0A058ZA58_FONAL|nr:hypothetical protein H696_02761 [Fonticula alba]KCV70417.1 hypothetical protein H696_02761 [Fonticula alba]|eukprot:XP_009494933.1 hypothetical protein H696_02761 [Fonticula alba]
MTYQTLSLPGVLSPFAWGLATDFVHSIYLSLMIRRDLSSNTYHRSNRLLGAVAYFLMHFSSEILLRFLFGEPPLSGLANITLPRVVVALAGWALVIHAQIPLPRPGLFFLALAEGWMTYKKQGDMINHAMKVYGSENILPAMAVGVICGAWSLCLRCCPRNSVFPWQLPAHISLPVLPLSLSLSPSSSTHARLHPLSQHSVLNSAFMRGIFSVIRFGGVSNPGGDLLTNPVLRVAFFTSGAFLLKSRLAPSAARILTPQVAVLLSGPHLDAAIIVAMTVAFLYLLGLVRRSLH